MCVPFHPSPPVRVSETEVPPDQTFTASAAPPTERILAGVEYEWDPGKDRINLEKHGISFAEASTVFLDPLHVTVFDERHSIGEFRFRTIGYTTTNRLIVVAHADREDRMRIITAREATPPERRHYEQST
jgi:uncharacterized DUF497 family protein